MYDITNLSTSPRLCCISPLQPTNIKRTVVVFISQLKATAGFIKLHMSLVVLVKKMSVLINILLQNINLVSVLSKICPNLTQVTNFMNSATAICRANYPNYSQIQTKFLLLSLVCFLKSLKNTCLMLDILPLNCQLSCISNPP